MGINRQRHRDVRARLHGFETESCLFSKRASASDGVRHSNRSRRREGSDNAVERYARSVGRWRSDRSHRFIECVRRPLGDTSACAMSSHISSAGRYKHMASTPPRERTIKKVAYHSLSGRSSAETFCVPDSTQCPHLNC